MVSLAFCFSSIPLDGLKISSPFFLFFFFFWGGLSLLRTVLLLSVNLHLGLFVCHPTKLRSNKSVIQANKSLSLSIQEETGEGANFVDSDDATIFFFLFTISTPSAFCLLPSAYVSLLLKVTVKELGWSLHLSFLATLFKRRLISHWLLPPFFRFIHTSQNTRKKIKKLVS